MKFILFAVAFILPEIALKAQSSSFEASDIYVHLDKTIYTNNENIWFTGYFLNNDFDTADRHALYVVLIDPVQRKVVASDRFTMSDGVGKGNLFIADTLSPGDYTFVAYTNAFLRGYPERPFVGRIRLRSPGRQPPKVLPGTDTLIRLDYYPEGGRLVHDHICRLEMQITGNHTGGRLYRGVLLSDKDSVSEFESNESGRCTIYFKPQQSGHYHVQLDSVGPKVQVVQRFPPVLILGYSLHLINQIRDTLRLSILSSYNFSTVFIRVQKGDIPLYSGKMQFSGEGALINVDARNFPPGIATILLLDKDSMVVASRDVYIPEPGMHCEIRFDSASYHSRSKVKVHLHITDSNGRGVKASFSLAAVHAKRLDALRFMGISDEGSTYTRLKIPDPEIDHAMMINSWSSFNVPRGRSRPEDDYGQVFKNGKRLKRPEQLLLTGAGMGIVMTDSSGGFELPHGLLLARGDVKINLSIVGKEWNDYSISLANSYDSVNKELAAALGTSINPMVLNRRENEISNVSDLDDGGDILFPPASVKLLQVVTVKHRREAEPDGIFRTIAGEFRSVTCSDWVCMNGILNCRNHPRGDKPNDGEYYLYSDGPGGQMMTVVYHGCKEKGRETAVVKKVNAIHIGKDFYAANYQEFNPADPEINTTVLWSSLNSSDENGDADISFYTNDISGRFAIVLEGMTERGGLSERSNFFVNP